MKHKIDHMELIQLVVDIKIKHSIFKTCMLQVLFAEYCFLHRYAPVNAKGFILDIDAAISFGMIEFVALVLEDGGFGENGEAMGESSWNKELTMIVFRQFHGHMLAKCRRSFTDVNGYVKDCALNAAHEFALGIWHSLIMQATHHAV